MTKRWSILLIVGLLGISGCQNCGQAKREAEEAARAAAEAEATAAREAEERAAREAAEREVAERAAAEAAAAAAAAEAARHHVVAAGDCLWCIAEDRWNDGYRWGEIYEANRDQIRDPDLIYPGQDLTIP